MKFFKVILACVLTAGIVSSCTMEASEIQQPKEEIIQVKTQKIVLRDLEIHKTYFGKTQYAQSTRFTAKGAGTIHQLPIKTGQKVNKGDVLIAFPPANHQLQTDQARITYNELKTDYNRQSQLLASGAVSKLSVNQLKNRMQVQQKVLEQMEAVNIIKAPFSGVITDVFVNNGQDIEPGAPFFSMAKTDHIKVEFFVTPKEAPSIQSGSSVTMTLNNGEQLTGKINQKALQIDPKRKAFKVTASFNNTDHSILTGNTVEVRVVSKTLKNAIVIPSNTVMKLSISYYAFVARDGKAIKRKIQLKDRHELQIEVAGGLQPGDELIVAGINKLKENSRIQIVK